MTKIKNNYLLIMLRSLDKDKNQFFSIGCQRIDKNKLFNDEISCDCGFVSLSKGFKVVFEI